MWYSRGMNNDSSKPVQSSSSVVKPINVSSKKPILVGVGIVIVLVGLGVGWLVSGKSARRGSVVPSVMVSKTEAGIADTSSFKDTATGTLKKGGKDGEGTFHLERPGGESQTVYLTSTVVDMGPFVDKKVQVWGQTQAGKATGWFMDVGKIKIVE